MWKKIKDYFTNKFNVQTNTKNLKWERHIYTFNPYAPFCEYHGYSRRTKKLFASIAYDSIKGIYTVFDGRTFTDLEEAKEYCDRM